MPCIVLNVLSHTRRGAVLADCLSITDVSIGLAVSLEYPSFNRHAYEMREVVS
jgi:hypothetical protein